jgi:type III secretion system low calcium response chaperone LcrH/SycD
VKDKNTMSTHSNDADQLSGEDLSAITARIAAHFREGGTLGDLAGITDEQFEALYAAAYRLYGTEQFEDAAKLFAYLGMTDPYDRRYTLGLGACQQMLKKWDEAIAAYTLCIALDVADPVPAFHMAECVAGKGDLADAQLLLTELVQRCKAPEHQAIKQKADAMLQLMALRAARTAATAPVKS